jgi:putative aldouronate transport system substrate-binding protein
MFRKDLVDQFGWDITTVKSLADLEPMLADAASLGLKYPFLTQKTAMFYRWYIGSFDFFTADANTNFFAVDRFLGSRHRHQRSGSEECRV